MIDKDVAPGWENRAVHSLLKDMLVEQRRRRRWGIFFKLIGLLWLFLFVIGLVSLSTMARSNLSGAAGARAHTALVSLTGEIADNKPASAENILRALDAAFASNGTKGVILRINSPGGSPAQSSIINAEITRLRKKYPNIPLYAVAEDICASGSYFVAVAADKIFVNPTSLVGSIGVIINGFGFTGTMDKLGIERRKLTAGKDKGFLDPFSPRNPDEEKFVQGVLNDIHGQFIAAVKKGRGTRLKAPDETLFNGLAWSGDESVRLGLADDFGSVGDVARDVIKAGDIVDYTVQEHWLMRLGAAVGAAMGSQMGQVLTTAETVEKIR